MAKVIGLKCLYCGSEFAELPIFDGCPRCRTEKFSSNLAPIYDYMKIKKSILQKTFSAKKQDLWSFKEFLPVKENNIVTLSEGGTPLIRCDELGKEWGLKNLYLKDESRNPTHSFKDRLATVVVSKAKEVGAKVVTVSSTGNHGAAIAAYAAKAGLDCVIFTSDSVPWTMKILMQVYGAKVVALANPCDRWKIMKNCIDNLNWYPAGNYISPPVGSNFYGIEGYKTMAYELYLDLNGKAPNRIVQPVAYADGLSGLWRGFKELSEFNLIDTLPVLTVAEISGSLKNALDKNLDYIEPMERKPTVAFSIGNGMSTYQGLAALRESKGTSVQVEDKELEAMQVDLGRFGLYAEVSSLASLVAIKKLCAEGKIDENEIVVAIITSTGLKDPQMTTRSLPEVPLIDCEMKSLSGALRKNYGFEI